MYRKKLTHGAKVILRLLPKKNGLVILTFHNILPGHFIKFENLIIRLKEKYTFISPADILDNNESDKGIKILVTFDDGFYSNKIIYEKVLRKYGINAYFFVCEDFIGLDRARWREFISRGFMLDLSTEEIRGGLFHPMGWDDLASLISDGNVIGAHTKTHSNLSGIRSDSELLDEILYSTDRVESRLGVRIDSFAYPFGKGQHLDQRVLEITKKRFSLAFTNVRGFYHESPCSHLIYRQNIRADDLLGLNEAFTTGQADWMYTNDRAHLQKLV